jgi:hypothetical protein
VYEIKLDLSTYTHNMYSLLILYNLSKKLCLKPSAEINLFTPTKRPLPPSSSYPFESQLYSRIGESMLYFLDERRPK